MERRIIALIVKANFVFELHVSSEIQERSKVIFFASCEVAIRHRRSNTRPGCVEGSKLELTMAS